MTKRVVLFGIISALLLSGCGRNTPASTAAPVYLGGAKAATVTQPTSPSLESTSPVEDSSSSVGEWLEEDEPATPEVAASTEAEIAAAEAAAKKAAEEAAAKKAAEEAAAKAAAEKAAEEAAAKKAAEEAAAAEAAKLKVVPTFAKSIGNGSLHAALGLALDAGKLYVVDNQRTGLLGKYAAVRVYDAATGAYAQVSFENIGWAGAKNLPVTISKVKLEGGKLFAADAAYTYSYDMATGDLIAKTEGTFAQVLQVTDPVTGDVFKLNGAKIDRIHDGTVTASFGSDVLGGEAAGIAIAADGTLYVTDSVKGLVHVFNPIKN